jgi:hypothetical protein
MGNKEEFPEQWKESIILPIYWKSDRTDCGYYRAISLLSTLFKSVSNFLFSRLSPYVDETIRVHQCWFGHNKSTIDRIICIRQIPKIEWEYNEIVHQAFSGYKKAYDSGRRELLYNILLEFG